MISTATPTLPSGLGFNPLKAGYGLVKKSITVPTKLAIRAVRDPNVQRAAVAAGQTYAQQNYATQYAQGQGYVNTARGILRPPQGGMQTAQMPQDDGGGMMPDGGAPAGVNTNSHMMLYGLIGVGVIAVLLMMKK